MRKSVVFAISISLAFANLLVNQNAAKAVDDYPVFDIALCTIVGTPAADLDLVGTEDDDVICGLGGGDVINALGGNDIIWGGAEGDTINGGPGTDIIMGEDGNDTIDAGEGDDDILAGDGDDYVSSGLGGDTLFGGAGDDELLGEAGDDWVDGEAGSDEIFLDAGNDYAEGGSGSDRLFGGNGEDALLAEVGADWINGGKGVDTGNGGDGIDYCVKTTEDDIKSCFNDNTSPSLISISVSPKEIDTSESSQEVTVRFRLKDTGSGILGYCDEGVQYSPSGTPCSSWRIYLGFDANNQTFEAGMDMRFCDSNGFRPDFDLGKMGSVCRISGSPTDGIYEGKLKIPKSTQKTVFQLNRFDAWDDAGNRFQADMTELATKKMRVSFRQIAAGDNKAPVLVSASFSQDTIDTSDGQKIIKLRGRVKDEGSGTDRVYFGIATLPKQVGGYGLQVRQNASATLVKGTIYNGVWETEYVIPKNFPEATVYLVTFQTEDLADNFRVTGKDDYGTELKEKKLRVSFKQTGPGDGTPPAVARISFNPTSVNVSSEAVWVAVDFKINDKGGFFNSDTTWGETVENSAFGGCLDGAGGVQICFQVGAIVSQYSDLSELDGVAYRVSGDAKSGVYRTAFLVPANTRKGQMQISFLDVFDSVGNRVMIDQKLASKGLDKFITIQ